MKFWTVVPLAACLAGCGNMLIGEITPEVLPDLADEMNERGTLEIGKDFPGVTMHARVDSGDTLVVMMGNVPLGNRTYDPNAVRRLLRSEVCSDSNLSELISNGGKVRLEMTSNFGKELPAVQFARCG
ncbi:hypothetical protein [uncultured Erythrobacter sp.]|uniref:hypothetical protein n=1 Tax=uncultured Erythrobacter sp. TaxID=263913 RepID=UPI0026378023|nr:hypothetical protein [uncultured Erythrobacter sp.]